MTAEHLGALLVVVGVTAGLTIATRRFPGPWITLVSRVLGLAIALAEPSYWIGQAAHGAFSFRDDLPLHLSRVAEFVSAAALWWPKPFLVELTYFWGLGAIVQALLTPDIQQHFPDPAYFRFYVGHGGVLVAAVLLTVGRRIYPRPGATLRVFAATIVVSAVAALADAATGGNYMFLRAKPVNSSLLNFMGPWPWYVASGLVLAIAFLALLNAPFWLIRRRLTGSESTG